MKIYITIWSANELTVVSILQPGSGYLAAILVTMISEIIQNKATRRITKTFLNDANENTMYLLQVRI